MVAVSSVGFSAASQREDEDLTHGVTLRREPVVNIVRIASCPAAAERYGSHRNRLIEKGVPVSLDELEEMGPIDYVLIAWPDPHPNGEIAPLLVDLVDRGIIRILDLAFVAKADDGSVAGLEIADVGEQVAELKVFEGASSGLLSDDDLEEAGAALDPGSAAAVLVFENRWAAPFAVAVRRSGGQLVANGRIPTQAILAALDASEDAESATATS